MPWAPLKFFLLAHIKESNNSAQSLSWNFSHNWEEVQLICLWINFFRWFFFHSPDGHRRKGGTPRSLIWTRRDLSILTFSRWPRSFPDRVPRYLQPILPSFILGPAYMEVGDPCKRGNPPVQIISYFNLGHVYMIGGVTRLGGLPGLPGRVTLSVGVTICHVNVSRWGNPPSRGRFHGKKL